MGGRGDAEPKQTHPSSFMSNKELSQVDILTPALFSSALCDSFARQWIFSLHLIMITMEIHTQQRPSPEAHSGCQYLETFICNEFVIVVAAGEVHHQINSTFGGNQTRVLLDSPSSEVLCNRQGEM